MCFNELLIIPADDTYLLLQAAGTAAPSMVSAALLRIQDKAGTEEEIVYLEKAVKEACASAYAGMYS
jgi:hypothetical protein